MQLIPFGALALAGALTAAALPAQTIERRVAAAPDGTVRLSFTAREGVCGNGHNVSIRDNDRSSDWESDCEHGPVRAVLSVSGGKVTHISTYVGGRWKTNTSDGAVTDLGMVPAHDAADYMLSLASQIHGGNNDAVFAATLADSAVVWPGLIRIARNESLSKDTRRTAIFWLGQAAGQAATASLDSIVGDDKGNREVRDAAVFALSQRPHAEGVPVLIRVARTDRDPEIRRKAIFWLGQSDDPRALALFEELLTKR